MNFESSPELVIFVGPLFAVLSFYCDIYDYT